MSSAPGASGRHFPILACALVLSDISVDHAAHMKAKPCYLLLSNMYPSTGQPVHGVFVRNMERELTARGVDVEHVVIRGRPQGLAGKLYAYTRYTISGIRKLLPNRHHLVYVHFISLSAIPLFLCWPLYKGKVVFNAHGSDLLPDTRVKSVMLKLMGAIIRRADLLVVPSSYYAKVAGKVFPGVELFISPSGGVNGDLFFPDPARTYDNRSIHIGFISRIDPGKGWDTLADAIDLLSRTTQIQVTLTMVGSGRKRQTLLDQISHLKLNSVVKCIEKRPQEELGALYRSFDIFVFPTRLPESLGLVGLEALCCGVPVIASKIGGPAEYIEPGVNGWLFLPGDALELCEAIIHYSSLDPDQRRVYSQNAASIIGQYDRDIVADRLHQKLKQIRSS